MAFDENLAQRFREILSKTKGITERKMFGGICFMVNGNMIGGVLKEDLIVKVGKENHNKAIADKNARSFNFTGKPMVGILYVAPEGVKTKAALSKWVAMGLTHAQSLPKKRKK